MNGSRSASASFRRESASGARRSADHGVAGLALPARLGRFELAVRLAGGGFGEVYLARAHGSIDAFQRYFAVKVVHPHLIADPGFVAMFLDEVRVASMLHHPNICSVVDAGQHEGRYFLAMEYVTGEPLSAVARALARPDAVMPRRDRIRVAAEIVRQAAAGLHAAHTARSPDGTPLEIVHRDVSPPNLFVGHDGRVVVLDFGIAQFNGRSTHTRTGTVKGHLPYMAPEQFRGGASRASDLWALGVLLHELLSAKRLFARPTDAETMHAVIVEPIPPLPEDVPPPLVELVERLLVRAPEERTSDAEEVAAQLAAFLGSQPVDLGAALAVLVPGAQARHRELFAKADGLLRGSRPAPPEAAAPVDAGARSRVIATGEPRGRAGMRAVGAAAAVALAGFAAFAITVALREGAPTEPAPVAPPREVVSEPLAAPPSEAPAPTPAASRDEPDEPAASASDSTEPPDRAPSDRVARTARASAVPGDRTPGTLFLSTPGGWAEVHERGVLLGETPGRFELAPGRHTLRITPGDGRAPRTITVVVPPGGTLQRSVALGGQ